jgi:hypothetical protein
MRPRTPSRVSAGEKTPRGSGQARASCGLRGKLLVYLKVKCPGLGTGIEIILLLQPAATSLTSANLICTGPTSRLILSGSHGQPIEPLYGRTLTD